MDLIIQTIISSAVAGAVIGFFSIIYKEFHTDSREIKSWQRNKLISSAEEAFVALNELNTSKATGLVINKLSEEIPDLFPSEIPADPKELFTEAMEQLNVKELSIKEQIEYLGKSERAEFIFQVLGTKELHESFFNLREVIVDPDTDPSEASDYIEMFVSNLKDTLGKPPKLNKKSN